MTASYQRRARAWRRRTPPVPTIDLRADGTGELWGDPCDPVVQLGVGIAMALRARQLPARPVLEVVR